MQRWVSFRPAAAMAVALLVGVWGAGCGGSGGSESQLWADTLDLAERREQYFLPAAEAGDLPERLLHEEIAGILGAVLERNPDAPADGLRGVLEQMYENKQRLANEQVTGAEAEEIRQRHEEYWSHLAQQQLPPDYQ